MKLSFFLVFSGCELSTSSEQKNSDKPANDFEKTLLELAPAITANVFNALSTHLGAQLQTNGVAEALKYCNLNAIPLTDTLSKRHRVEISRLALRNRNEQNRLTADEELIYEKFLSQNALTEPIKPIVRPLDSLNMVWYAPIVMSSAVCLKCHGTPGIDIAQDDYVLINLFYPADKATGFKMGDLRGIWRLVFNKQHLKEYQNK